MPRNRVPARETTTPATARGEQLDDARRAYDQAEAQAWDDYHAAVAAAHDTACTRIAGYAAEYDATVERIRAGDGAASLELTP